jgi:putative peptide zinc metalloprotease protein
VLRPGPSRSTGQVLPAAELDQGLLVRQAAKFDDAGPGGSIVCELANGRCLRMSPSAFWLYAELQRGSAPAQIAEAIEHRFGQRVSAEEIATACAGLLERIRDESQRVAQATRRRYAFRVRLVPERIVARLAGRLTWLISGPMLALWALGVAASAFLFARAGTSAVDAGSLNLGATVIAAYLIYLIAPVGHELGHAAACSRFGVGAGDIGFAVYFIFPAVYCDVTRAWLLPRRQRVVVDVAGMLFEAAVGAIFSAVGVIFRAPVFLVASFMVLGNLLIALNPLGRFDSYWALSDAFGISDLSKQRSSFLRQRAVSYVGIRRVVIACYTGLTVFVLGWYFYTAARLAEPFAERFKVAAVAMSHNFEAGRPLAGLHDLIGISPGVLMLVILLYRLGRIVPPVFRKIVRARNAELAGPPRRPAPGQ